MRSPFVAQGALRLWRERSGIKNRGAGALGLFCCVWAIPTYRSWQRRSELDEAEGTPFDSLCHPASRERQWPAVLLQIFGEPVTYAGKKAARHSPGQP